ncbi:MAG: glycerol-3-phosphate 1-O-acyltransferase [Lentisphaerae bacterium]|nr:MAG: glycerol-3-phosphate 1-O-acyltransferase [Lentisphaerota bacterium]
MDYIRIGLIVSGAFLCGSIPFAFILGKCRGVDIRKEGSGNVGATNLGRCCGRPWGILCFALDFSKGLIPVLLSMKLADWAGCETPFNREILPILTALASVCGHIFTPFLGFKGGKGVATSAGALLPLSPWGLLTALVIWAVVLKLTRTMALASIAGAVVFPLAALMWRSLGISSGPGNMTCIFMSLISILTIVRHRSNIQRILAGKELKLETSANKH